MGAMTHEPSRYSFNQWKINPALSKISGGHIGAMTHEPSGYSFNQWKNNPALSKISGGHMGAMTPEPARYSFNEWKMNPAMSKIYFLRPFPANYFKHSISCMYSGDTHF